MHESVTRDPRAVRARPWLPLLACIRFDEVIVLQGAPMLGVCFALGDLTPHAMLKVALFAVASLCLVAHVFVLNDWAGINGDLRDPDRSARTFRTKGITRGEVGAAAAVLLAASLALFAWLGTPTLLLALAIAGSSALYSAPAVHLKGMPVLGTALHLVGGTLHFLLGYALFAPLDARGVAIGCFFGLVFAAGHLMHEARDFAGDRLNGIRTNAVAFGKARCFAMGVALFAAAHVLLALLASTGVVPRMLLAAAALGVVQLGASIAAWRAGLDRRSLVALQGRYRLVYAVIGVLMVVAVLR